MSYAPEDTPAMCTAFSQVSYGGDTEPRHRSSQGPHTLGAPELHVRWEAAVPGLHPHFILSSTINPSYKALSPLHAY